jgi:uncharacterized membrane protein SpoIIM required for sporulation
MLTLKSREFRRERETGWSELEALVSRAHEHGMKSLSTAELLRFPLLYRAALSSLSVARSIALDRALLAYLEDLALRAFLAIYARPLAIGESIREFLLRSLPRAVRSIKAQVFLALGALLLGILSGYLLVNGDEGWYTVIIPAGLAGGRGPASTREELSKVLFSKGRSGGSLLVFANLLFSNNTLVSLLAFGLGVLGGIPTILLIFANGLMAGAFIALHAHRGLAQEFTGWLLIHGVTELGAIVIFSAAGLKLGQLILFPGRHSRADALAIHGAAIGEAAVGGVLMLLVAAVLEGVFRETVANTDQRLIIAFVSFLFWTLYFTFVGRVPAAGKERTSP